MRGKPRRESLGPGRFEVCDYQMPRAGTEESEGYRCSRASGADLYHRIGCDEREAGLKAAHEADVVRVVTDGFSIVEGNGVHRAQDACVRGEAIQALLHQLFTGVGDIEPVVAELGCASDELGGTFGVLADDVEVDDAVGVGQAESACFSFVEAGRQRTADTGAEQSNDEAMAAVSL